MNEVDTPRVHHVWVWVGGANLFVQVALPSRVGEVPDLVPIEGEEHRVTAQPNYVTS